MQFPDKNQADEILADKIQAEKVESGRIQTNWIQNKRPNLCQDIIQLISLLRGNARMSVSSISRITCMSQSSVLRNLSRLEDKYLIRYTTLLDFSRLGYPVAVNLAIAARDKPGLKGFLSSHKNVNSAHVTSGRFDFYIESVFADLKSFYDFLDRLYDFGITDMDEHHVTEVISKESFLSKDASVLIEYPRHMSME